MEKFAFEPDRERLEQETGFRHELVDGQLYSMAGGTVEHNDIVENFAAILQVIYRGCKVYRHNCAVKFDAKNVYYPDIAVVCGKDGINRKDTAITIAPKVVVEVLSPSNMRPSSNYFDFETKIDTYRKSEIEAVYIIDPDKKRVKIHTKEASRTIFEDTITIESHTFDKSLLFEENLDAIAIQDILRHKGNL